MEYIPNQFLTITANVGSLFEENGHQLQINWLNEFKKLVSKQNAVFIALHFQEVGGKSHETCIDTINTFLRNIYELLEDFTCSQSFVDQEISEDKYTAMGSSYFIHNSLTDVQIFNFETSCYCSISPSREVHSISDDCTTIRKYKFPLHCFSKNIKRVPRKGFLWTKWKIRCKTFDIVNIHLPHDADNVRATLKFSTKYAKYRRNTLKYTLDRIRETPCDHQLIFGDFNVRADTRALVEYITSNITNKQIVANGDCKTPKLLRYVSNDDENEDVLKIEARLFHLNNYEMFHRDKVADLLQFDKELIWVKDEYNYKESNIAFQPTYPHTEDPKCTSGVSFSTVRCPSWCDRILMDSKFYNEITKNGDIVYDSYGMETIIGDHKPVYLSFLLDKAPQLD